MFAAPVRHRALQTTAVLLSSFLLLFLVHSDEAHAARKRKNKSSVAYAESEMSFRYLMNAERTARSRARLRMNEALVSVAREQSEDMSQSGGIYHNPDLASDLRQVSWSIAGENVGVGNSVESLHQAFMDSAPHRENVLRKAFRKVGVGVVTADGRIWVTVVFAG